MDHDPIAAADALTDVLSRENAALAVVDMLGATGLFAEKQAATEALLRARAGLATLNPARWDAARAAIARLDEAGTRNRELLARAIRVQGRVVALLARAAPPQRATYGMSRPATAAPVAMSLRA